MKKIIFSIVGAIEVVIGLITLLSCFVVQTWNIFGYAPKPFSVYVFVVVSAVISFVLGVGMLSYRDWARKLLIFFSGYIVLTKVMIYTKLLTFSGDILTIIPVWSKDMVSVFYHVGLIIVLIRFCGDDSHGSSRNG